MTLEQVAALAGVSRSTVSRVLNNHPSVNQSTRRRVLEVVRAHDFHPNQAARALASRRSQIIGLVIPQPLHSVFSEPYFGALISGTSAACAERGYYLMLSLAAPSAPDAYSRIIAGGHVDGLLVASAILNSPLVARLHDERFPFVLVGRDPNRTDVPTVDVDNQQGAAKVAMHFVRIGYKRIGTITGPMSMVAALDRHHGFLGGLRSAGLACPDSAIAEGDWSEQSGYLAMLRLLAAPQHPQAVFVASDNMAIGALRAIRGAGLRVPQDIALVGFDDLPLAEAVDPPLTTVRQPIPQIGYTAATLLIDLLNRPGRAEDGWPAAPASERIILPTELIVRQSCGLVRRFLSTSEIPATS